MQAVGDCLGTSTSLQPLYRTDVIFSFHQRKLSRWAFDFLLKRRLYSQQLYSMNQRVQRLYPRRSTETQHSFLKDDLVSPTTVSAHMIAIAGDEDRSWWILR